MLTELDKLRVKIKKILSHCSRHMQSMSEHVLPAERARLHVSFLETGRTDNFS